MLFHYPIFEWDGYYYNSIHLYGYIHQAKMPLHARAFNVSYDFNARFLGIDEIMMMAKNISNLKN
ncbi:MAG: hypothetical protein MR902_06100 [Campylobacter sp.]|nr:hypothetical protein [Campylobacter sp.]